MESHTLLSHLAQVWAYVSLGASGILTEEAAPLVGGFAAHEGHLGFVRVVLACAIGVWAAGIGLYVLGRWRGKWVRKRFRRIGRYVTRLLVFVRRRPWRSTFAVRFAFGARIVLPIACGAARLRIPVFLIGSAVASLVWAALFATLGWLFGDAALLVIGHIRRYEDVIAGLLVASVVVVAVILIIRHRPPPLIDQTETTGSGPALPD